MLRRERKRRLEAANAFRDGGREDLASGEEAEGELIGGYLPAELSDAELQAIVERALGRQRRAVAKGHGPVDEERDGGRRWACGRQAGLGLVRAALGG